MKEAAVYRVPVAEVHRASPFRIPESVVSERGANVAEQNQNELMYEIELLREAKASIVSLEASIHGLFDRLRQARNELDALSIALERDNDHTSTNV